MKTKYQSLFPSILSIEELAVKIEEDARYRKRFAAWNAEEQMQFFELCTGISGPARMWDFLLQELFFEGKNRLMLKRMLECLLGIEIERVELVRKEKENEKNEFCVLEAYLWEKMQSTDSCAGCKIEERYVKLYKSECDHISNQIVESVGRKGIKEYTIVLYECAPGELRDYKECFIHHGCQQFDTGAHIDSMQEYCFVVKDIFLNMIKSNGVQNETEAWIAFLTIDDSELLWNLLIEYPLFWSLYDSFYALCSYKLSFIMSNIK